MESDNVETVGLSGALTIVSYEGYQGIHNRLTRICLMDCVIITK